MLKILRQTTARAALNNIMIAIIHVNQTCIHISEFSRRAVKIDLFMLCMLHHLVRDFEIDIEVRKVKYSEAVAVELPQYYK